MSVVVPAILPKTYEDLSTHLKQVHGIAERVQIDICDGNFVDATTWPYTHSDGGKVPRNTSGETLDMLPCAEDFRLEVDLMVARPEEVVGTWIELGARRVIVHAASTDRMGEVIELLKHQYGYDKDFAPDLLSFGIAISLDTPAEKYEPYLADAEFVQFMGIARIGHQGQPFDTRVLDRVRAFRKKYPEKHIQVDGGVSLETAPKLFEAGVDTVAVGSALFGSADVTHTVREFEKLAEQYGIFE